MHHGQLWSQIVNQTGLRSLARQRPARSRTKRARLDLAAAGGGDQTIRRSQGVDGTGGESDRDQQSHRSCRRATGCQPLLGSFDAGDLYCAYGSRRGWQVDRVARHLPRCRMERGRHPGGWSQPALLSTAPVHSCIGVPGGRRDRQTVQCEPLAYRTSPSGSG